MPDFDFTAQPYMETHVSWFDGSPAMLVRERKGMVRMVNEEGYVWSDPASRWIAIGDETPADYARWAKEEDNEDYSYAYEDGMLSAEEQEYYDPMGYQSDSYIAYLNG